MEGWIILKARLIQRSESSIDLVMGFPVAFWSGYVLADAG